MFPSSWGENPCLRPHNFIIWPSLYEHPTQKRIMRKRSSPFSKTCHVEISSCQKRKVTQIVVFLSLTRGIYCYVSFLPFILSNAIRELRSRNVDCQTPVTATLRKNKTRKCITDWFLCARQKNPQPTWSNNALKCMQDSLGLGQKSVKEL